MIELYEDEDENAGKEPAIEGASTLWQWQWRRQRQIDIKYQRRFVGSDNRGYNKGHTEELLLLLL